MNKLKPSQFLAQTLFFFWIVVIIGLYCLASSRFSSLYMTDVTKLHLLSGRLALIRPGEEIVSLFVSMFGIFVFTLSCVSIGFRMLESLFGWAVDVDEDWIARFSTAFVLGEIALSIPLLIAGVYHWLTQTFVYIVFFAGFLSGLLPIWRYSRSRFSLSVGGETGGFEKWLFGLSLAAIVFTIFNSTSRLSYDSVALYFSNAKITAMTGGLQYFLNDSFITSAFHTEILYVAVIQVFGDTASRLISWSNGLVIILACLSLACRMGLSQRARAILLAMLASSTAFIDLFGDGKIDLLCTAPALLAVYWMTVPGAENHSRRHFLIGILAGFAMIARPFNLVLLGLFLAIYYLTGNISFSEKKLNISFRTFFNHTTWAGMGVVLMLGFHLLINWLVFGDPLAPLAFIWKLDTSLWQWAIDPEDLWLFRLFYPFGITFINSPQSLGGISPILLAFLPGVASRRIRNEVGVSPGLMSISMMALFVLLAWINLYFTVVEVRYVFFLLFVLFLPLSQLAATVIGSTSPLFSNLIKPALLLLIAFIGIRTLSVAVLAYTPLDEAGNRQCLDFKLCNFLEPVNNNAGVGERVLTMNAFRYYLRPDLFACSARANEYRLLRHASKLGPEGFWREVYRQGYTYLIYESNYSNRHLFISFVPAPGNTPDWMELVPVFGAPGDDEVAYKIIVHDPPVSVEKTCGQNAQRGGWGISLINLQ